MTDTPESYEEVEGIAATHPWVNYRVELDHDETPTHATLRVVVEPHARETTSVNQAPRWRSLQAVSILGSVFAFFAFMASLSAIAGAVGFLLVGTAIASYFRARQLERYVASVAEVEQVLQDFSVVDRIDSSWVEAIQEDEETHSLALPWFLAKPEIDQLEAHIDEGVQARKRLSPMDPMRRTMQVEIETLRSKRDGLKAIRHEDAERITQAAQRYQTERQSRRVAAERRREEKDRQLKHEERLRAIGDKAETQWEAQERAQKWLYGNE